MKYILFQDILKVLKHAINDQYFSIGEHVVERVEGWPQGGPFSEPGTCMDLGYCAAKFLSARENWQEVGMQHKDLEGAKILAGVVYVDDGLFASKIFCVKCIFQALGRVWPKDVGITLEEYGRRICFLQLLYFS